MEIESILHLWNLKGIANGVAAEEKKGNKRPKAEERLVPSIFLFYYSFFLQCLWELVEIVKCSSKELFTSYGSYIT